MSLESVGSPTRTTEHDSLVNSYKTISGEQEDWLEKLPVRLNSVDSICILMLGIGCVVIVNSCYTDLGWFTVELGPKVVFMIPLALNVP